MAIVRTQDSSCQQGYLSHPLRLSNTKGALEEIVAPDHPIFATPHELPSLAGTVSCDTIVDADAARDVLASLAVGE